MAAVAELPPWELALQRANKYLHESRDAETPRLRDALAEMAAVEMHNCTYLANATVGRDRRPTDPAPPPGKESHHENL